MTEKSAYEDGVGKGSEDTLKMIMMAIKSETGDGENKSSTKHRKKKENA